MASSPRSAAAERAPRFIGYEKPRVWTPPLRRLTRRSSRGYECIAFAEEVLELELLPWQKWLLIHALELLPDGTFRFRTVVLLVARQNGKSTLMQILSLWRMFVDGAPLVIGTAQNLDIAEEVWQGAVDMAKEVDELAAEIEKVDLTNGKKALRLVSGSRYKVQAASRRGGLGLSGDLILLDELREHQTWDAWSAVTKTTMARLLAQIWAASNAGDNSSIVLKHLRMLAHLAIGDPDGINGEDAVLEVEPEDGMDDDSLGIFEWSAAPGCDIWDRDGWAQANPSLGYTITERAIAAAARTDPERVFRTEVLCQWVDTMRDGAFPAGVWESSTCSASTKIIGTPVVCVDVRTGINQQASIVVAGSTAQGFDLVQVVRYEPDSGQDIVNEALVLLAQRRLKSVVIDRFGENLHIIPLFQDAGIEVITPDHTDMRAAAVAFSDAVINGRIKHKSDEPLNVAVLGAGKRVTDAGFTWSQSKSTTDISPLRAATAAWWVHTSKGLGDYDPLASLHHG